MKTATNIHGITFTTGETITRGRGVNMEVKSKIDAIEIGRDVVRQRDFIRLDFGPIAKSKRE